MSIEVGSKVRFYLAPRSVNGWNTSKGEWIYGIYQGYTLPAGKIDKEHTVTVYREDATLLLTAYFLNTDNLMPATQAEYEEGREGV